MIGKSAPMTRVKALIAKAARGMSNALIEGESGTGKELAAQAIHAQSARRHRPFVAVNCAALQDSLAESELFGHERGAFTGAVCHQAGLFELAGGGTIFLDEMGEASLPVQAKLLRAIETRTVRRLGGRQTIEVDVRIIAATNRDLKQAAADGRFREDLYYRLNVFPIKIPPLRERREDIMELAAHFLEQCAKQNQRNVFGFTTEAESILTSYHWPGNVRQLKNVVEQAVAMGSEDVVMRNDLPEALLEEPSTAPMDLHEADKEFRRQLFQHAFDLAGGQYKKAAALLGISPKTVHRHLRSLKPQIAQIKRI